jgi:acyl-CoA thioester hydrolase
VEGFGFSTELAVRFAETDAQRIAHNSVYLVWYEVARIAYLARHAGGYQRLRNAGFEALTIETHVRYLAPAHFDDRLTVHARVSDIRGARFRFDYAIERGAVLVADGWTHHAVVDSETMRPTRLPDWLTAAIADAEERSSSQPVG